MTVPKQAAVFIDVSKGLAQDIDSDLLPFGNLIMATNCEYTQKGGLAKRAGHTRIVPSATYSIQDAGGPFQIANYKGAPIYLSGTTKQYPLLQYNSGSNTVFSPDPSGPVPTNGVRANIGVRRIPLESEWSPTSPTACDVAYAENVICYVYQTSTASSRVIFIDKKTGLKIAETAVTSGVSTPDAKVVAFQESNGSNWHIMVFYNNGAVLSWQRWKITGNTWTTQSPTASGTVGTMGGANLYDIHVPVPSAVQDFKVLIAYQDSAAPTTTVQLAEYTVAGGVINTATATVNVTMALSFLADLGGSGRRFLATAGVTDGVRVYVMAPTTWAAVTTLTMSAADTLRVRKITGCSVSSDTAGEARILYTVGDATTTLNDVIKAAEKLTGVAVSNSTWLRSVALSSRLFWDFMPDGTLTGFVAVSHDSTVNGAYYIMHFDVTEAATLVGNRTPQAIFMPRAGGVAFGNIVNIGPSPTGTYGYSHVFTGVFMRKQRILAVGASSTITYAAERMDFDFHPTKMCGNPQSVSDWLLMPGGTLRMYDGNFHGEYGFIQQPEVGALAESGGGALTALGVYTYRHVYEWIDNAGRLHRSAPSAPKTFTLTGANATLTYTVPTDRIASQYMGGKFKIGIYRNEASGTLFYRVGTATNSTTADTAAFADTTADSALISGELIYTTGTAGEELPNITAPSFSSIVEWRNRIVGIGETGKEIWFSKNIIIGAAPGFSESLVMDISAATEATGLAVLDDRLFIITKTGTRQVIGEVPDDTGGGEMPTSEEVAQRGTEFPRSIAVFDGIYFASREQIIKLDRGMQATTMPAIDTWTRGLSLGNDVTIAWARDVLTALVLPDRRQIRWYHGSGACAFYDIDRGVWTNGSLGHNVGAVCEYVNYTYLISGALIVGTLFSQSVFSSERLLMEDPTRGEDGSINGNDGVAFFQDVRLPWFAGGGRCAGQLVHEVHIRCTQGGSHTMVMAEYLNFNDVTSQETRDRYDTETGGDPILIRYVPKYEDCEAFMLALTDNGYTAGPVAPVQTRGFILWGVGIVFTPRTPGASLPNTAGTIAHAGGQPPG